MKLIFSCLFLLSLSFQAVAVDSSEQEECEKKLLEQSLEELVGSIKTRALRSFYDGSVETNQYAEILLKHSADWNERVRVWRAAHVDSDPQWNSSFGPHLIDALLGYDSWAQAMSEDRSPGDFFPDAPNQRTWKGAAPWTYYKVIQDLVRTHPSVKKIVDLGAGVGRVGMGFLALSSEDVEFVGYEFVPERVASANAWANRFGLSDRFKMIHQDLSDPNFELPDADLFYMYQPFTLKTEAIVLRKICALAVRLKKPITVSMSMMGAREDLCKDMNVKISRMPGNPAGHIRDWIFSP